MADLRYIYWDANPFCAVFNKEKDRLDKCVAVLNAAEAGELKIITSSNTLAEVVRVKGEPRIGPGQEAILYDFFQNDFIIFVNVEWFVGTQARRLIHDFPALKPMDAIHLATALRAKVAEMHTYDDDLCHLSGKVGVPPLSIRTPSLEAPELPLAEHRIIGGEPHSIELELE